jgi:cytochrome c oxidase assembly factor CtaG
VQHVSVIRTSAVPPLDSASLLSEWRPNPAVVLALLALGAAYLVGVRRRPGRWPARRTGCFLAGLVSVLVVCCSFVGVYAGYLFWMRATQNLVLLMISPLLLALGMPLTLLRDVLPATARSRASRALHSPAARLLTFPPAMALALIAPLFVVYLTPLYVPAQRHGWVAGPVGAAVVAFGFLYFWTRLRLDPTPRSDPHLVTVAMSIAEVVFDGALGLRLWLGPTIAAGYYAGVRTWGPDPRLDQTIGAGVLWIVGDLAGLVFLGFVARRMITEDEEQTARIDAELDAEQAVQEAKAVPATQTAPDAPSRPDQPRATDAGTPGGLWWETDPRIAHRYRQRNQD